VGDRELRPRGAGPAAEPARRVEAAEVEHPGAPVVLQRDGQRAGAGRHLDRHVPVPGRRPVIRPPHTRRHYGSRMRSAVLLHGVMARAETWWRIGPALAGRGWQVSAVDLPGHGRAPRLAGPADLATFAAATAGRLPNDVDLLVGHSLGAVVALALEDRARALVLED